MLGIISLLLSLLLVAVSGAVRRARIVACAGALRQVGTAFYAYSNDWDGTFPVAYLTVANRDKRWYDFLSPYTGTGFNEDGRERFAWLDRMDQPNVLWGCPERDVRDTSGTGYEMNIWALAQEGQPLYYRVNGSCWSQAGIIYADINPSLHGCFFRATQWVRPSEKALVADAPHYAEYSSIGGGFPWFSVAPDSAEVLGEPDVVPSIDQRRHAPSGAAVTQFTPSVNVLFVDGHVGLSGTRAAYDACTLGAY